MKVSCTLHPAPAVSLAVSDAAIMFEWDHELSPGQEYKNELSVCTMTFFIGPKGCESG